MHVRLLVLRLPSYGGRDPVGAGPIWCHPDDRLRPPRHPRDDVLPWDRSVSDLRSKRRGHPESDPPWLVHATRRVVLLLDHWPGLALFAVALLVRLAWVLSRPETLTWLDEQEFAAIAHD